VDCRRTEKSAFGLSNEAFLLNEMTSSVTRRKSHDVTDAGWPAPPPSASQLDVDACDLHCVTDDDDSHLVDSCWPSSYNELTTTDDGRARPGDCLSQSTTTRAVIEHSASTCGDADDASNDRLASNNEGNIILQQQPTGAASASFR